MIALLGMNIFTLLLCFIDKKSALHHKTRISERLLWFLILLGGAFGMQLGMIIFHHKTKKWKYRVLFVCILQFIFIGMEVLK